MFLFAVKQVPNSSPTAASASSDMYGAAVLDACEQIKTRMDPIASRHNFDSFAEVCVIVWNVWLCHSLLLPLFFPLAMMHAFVPFSWHLRAIWSE